MTNKLTPKQQKFIAAWQTGIDGTHAAIGAGYSRKSARYTAYHLLNENAAVMAEVAKVREQLAEDAKYNGEKCMAECDAGITFAKATNNANALARLIELKAKLTGLLVQKIDLNIENRANVAEALAEARARVQRPRCDPSPAIEGEFVALPGVAEGRTVDDQSRAAPYDSKVDLNL
jgi:phage terminase small subunit